MCASTQPGKSIVSDLQFRWANDPSPVTWSVIGGSIIYAQPYPIAIDRVVGWMIKDNNKTRSFKSILGGGRCFSGKREAIILSMLFRLDLLLLGHKTPCGQNHGEAESTYEPLMIARHTRVNLLTWMIAGHTRYHLNG